MDHNMDTLYHISGWDQCLRTNTSYLDCPIANWETEELYAMYVMVHDTSPVKSNHTAIAVPHGHYEVSILDRSTRQYAKAEDSSIICSDDHVSNGQEIKNCQLHVYGLQNQPKGSYFEEYNLLRVDYSKNTDLSIEP